jgi:aspartate/methionine/tyrosine aminotransferase
MAELGARIEDIELNGPGGYGYPPLMDAIAAHCGVSTDCVVGASGASMANFIAMAALIQPGDEVLVEYPVYDPLPAIARYFGGEIRRFPRGGPIGDVVSRQTRLIVVTNLHNPTCRSLDASALNELARVASSTGARVLVDEVYLECLYERMSSAFHLGPGFVCTSSLTKAYGLGGLRCGWILAAPDLAHRMWRIKDLIDTSASHPAEQLSVLAFRKLAALTARAKAILDGNRRLLSDFLQSCPRIQCDIPEYGTCVFPRIVGGDGDRLFNVLHNRYDTNIVPGRFFEMPDHFRLGIGGDPAVFAEGLRRLHLALDGEGNLEI